MTTVLHDDIAHTTDRENPALAGLWLSAIDAERITGWTLKPEGMCRDELCVPVAPESVRDDTIDIAAFWQRLGAPAIRTDSGDAWVLGASAAARNAQLAGGVAPDFTLPDAAGVPRTLSSLRGRKVFLATWASW